MILQLQIYMLIIISCFTSTKKIHNQPSQELNQSLSKRNETENLKSRINFKKLTNDKQDLQKKKLGELNHSDINLLTKKNDNKLTFEQLNNTFTNLRRFPKNLNELAKKILSFRVPSDPHDHNDCVSGDRKRLRFAPSNCYSKKWGDWSLNKEFWPFVKEIFNDLRFTFDFVLYDQRSNKSKLECKFWYLMYYLQSIVEDVKNPTDIIRTVEGQSKHYCNSSELLYVDRMMKGLQSEMFSITARVIAMIVKATVALVKALKPKLPSLPFGSFGFGGFGGFGKDSSESD